MLSAREDLALFAEVEVDHAAGDGVARVPQLSDAVLRDLAAEAGVGAPDLVRPRPVAGHRVPDEPGLLLLALPACICCSANCTNWLNWALSPVVSSDVSWERPWIIDRMDGASVFPAAIYPQRGADADDRVVHMMVP